MTTITVGTSATVTLSAGQQLQTTGIGQAVYGPGPMRGQSVTLLGNSTVGPFADRSQIVYVNAAPGSLTYEVVSPPFPPAYPANELTNAQVAATQALVSGGGNAREGLRKWRAARGKVLTGSGSATVLCLGDSRTFGRGSNGADFTNCKAKAVPRTLAQRMTALGLAARESSLFGTGRADLNPPTMTNFLSAETRVTLGAGWQQLVTETVGGYPFFNNSTTNSLSFTPTEAFDTIDIYDNANEAFADYTVNVDGGATLATVTASGESRIRKTTVTCDRATHTINIQATGTGKNFILLAVATSDSTASSVLVHSAGASGIQAVQAAASTGSTSYAAGIAAIAPDLTILNLGTNDWINGISASAFDSAMRSLITAAQTTGDVLLIVPPYSNPSVTALANQDAISNQIRALADSLSLPYIDQQAFIGAYAAANAEGMYFDDTHESGAGYYDQTVRLAGALLA